MIKDMTILSKIAFVLCLIILTVGLIAMFFIDNVEMMNHASFRLFEVILMIIITIVPALLGRLTGMKVPPAIETGLVAFCFSALILGDVADFYGRFSWWDLLLHALSGILLGIVACYILDKVCEKASAKASPLFIAVWSVCFVLAVGALWEMMEYVTDGMLGLNSQQFLESGGTFDESIPLPGREALRDTMEDMLLNLTGALILTAAMAFRRVKENQKMRPTAHRKAVPPLQE